MMVKTKRKETNRKARRILKITGLSVAIIAALAVTVIGLESYINPGNSKEKKDFVQTVAQTVGGTALLAGLYFTWRTVRINQEGQVTDRFTKAIEQLGAKDEAEKPLEKRLGGIHALARIAKDSPEDHWPIVEILTIYVQQHARWKPENPSRPSYIPPDLRYTEPYVMPQGFPSNVPSPVLSPESDVQAAMSVLGRRTQYFRKGEFRRLNLRNTDLRGTDLRSAHLEGASLQGAHLEEALLWGTRLEEASLAQAHLEGADLRDAHLEKASLIDAHLEGANLQGAHLKEAELWNADLTGTDLRNTDLRKAHFSQDKIDWAVGNKETVLPSGLPYLEMPPWWETSTTRDLVADQTYHVGSFRPALSFSVGEGWRTERNLATLEFDYLKLEYGETPTQAGLNQLSFHNVWGVYDDKNPDLKPSAWRLDWGDRKDLVIPAPKDMVTWFEEHRYLDTRGSEPVSMGAASGMKFNVAFQGDASDFPQEFIPLFYHRDEKRVFRFYEGLNYQVIVLDVKGETVTVVIPSSEEHSDEFATKADTVLDTVTWK